MFVHPCIASSEINTANLIGTWSSTEINESDYYISIVTYTSDGKKCTLGSSYSGNKSSEESIFISKWKVVGKQLDIKIVKSSTDLLIPGETISSQLISLTEKKLETRLYPSAFYIAPIETYLKISNTPDNRICSTAERILKLKTI